MDAVFGHSRTDHEEGKACFVSRRSSSRSPAGPVPLPHPSPPRPQTLWSVPHSWQCSPWVTSAFPLPQGTNTCKYVGLFGIFPFDLEVLKASTRHLTLCGRLPITVQNNTYFMCRRRRESVYSKINISTFIKHSTY